MSSCDSGHVKRASEWHEDGMLCGVWLENLERATFSPKLCNLIRRMVLWDAAVMLQQIDRGQLVRLDVSLSKALHRPTRRWGLFTTHPVLDMPDGMAASELDKDPPDASTFEA